MSEALLPVGKDCDCGCPLVWYRGEQRCSVYGRHPEPVEPVRFWDRSAPFASLVKAVMDCPNMAPAAVRRRVMRAAQREAA